MCGVLGPLYLDTVLMHTTDADDVEFHAYWHAFLEYLKAKASGQKTRPPDFHDGKPQGGTYDFGSDRLPARIYQADGQIWAILDGKPFTGNLNKLWLGCGRNAVSWEAYETRLQTGRWPDQIVNESPASDEITEPLPAGPIEVRLQDTTAAADTWLEANKPFKSKTEADEAANRIKALRDLIRPTEDAHEKEKAPHKKIVDAIDLKYLKNSVTPAKTLITKITAAITAFDVAERARQQKEAEERRAAEQKAIDEANWSNAEPGAEPVPLPIPMQEAPPREKERYGDSTGRGVIIKRRQIAKIVDQEAVYRHFVDTPELKACLLMLAQKAIDADKKVPGTETEEG
jgi:hypothetical protein